MDRLTRSLNCPALVDTSCSVLAVAASPLLGVGEAVFFSTNRGPLTKEFTLQENGNIQSLAFVGEEKIVASVVFNNPVVRSSFARVSHLLTFDEHVKMLCH